MFTVELIHFASGKVVLVLTNEETVELQEFDDERSANKYFDDYCLQAKKDGEIISGPIYEKIEETDQSYRGFRPN